VSAVRRAALIKRRAQELGFASVGITDLSPLPHRDALRRWLESGMAGEMTYMHRQAGRRTDPASILEGATRAVVVTRNYFTPDTGHSVGGGRIAKYARGRDYHDALAEPLEQLSQYVCSLGDTQTIARAWIDAGPVPERELAQRAGLGWIGKNTMLIHPTRGSFFFLASILTDLDVSTDTPFTADRCGTCRRCLDACPTAAFPEPRVLDSRRCISYLTIEHRGSIPADLEALMDDWIFGCDICQDVCPWNLRFAVPAHDPTLGIDPHLECVNLAELADIADHEFERRYGWTSLERPGVSGMRRNARIAAANHSRTRLPSG
jgi:epoxyqueuosine reductase